MRKLVIKTATGLIENVVEVPEESLVAAAQTALAAAEAAQDAAALDAAAKAVRMLSWNPPEGCEIMGDLPGAEPGDSVLDSVLVKLPSPPPVKTAAQLAQEAAVAAAAAQVTAEIKAAFADQGMLLSPAREAAVTNRQLDLIARAQGR